MVNCDILKEIDWQSIISIFSLLAALIAILTFVYKFGKMNAKLEILWDIFKAEARANTGRRGTMETSSHYRLTKKGLDMIPPNMKAELKNLANNNQGTKLLFFNRKKPNPGEIEIWEIIKKVGGVERLAEVASEAGVDVQEIVVMIETYIQRHLEE